MRKFFCVFLFIAPLLSSAQTGHYFLSHYAPDDERLNPVAFDIIQAGNGVLYFATRSGILSFDGRTWEKVSQQGAVYALEISEDGTTYWAGENGFGRLSRNKSGRTEIEILSSHQIHDVFQIAAVREGVYFMSDDSIFFYEYLKGTHVPVTVSEQPLSFTSLFSVFGVAYASTDTSGVFRLESDHLSTAMWNNRKRLEIIFAARFDDQYIMGTTDSRLFICRKDLVLQEVPLKERDFVRASMIVNAAWISGQLLAVGTLRGGILCIDPETGRIEERIDYHTGLPDNEVYALMSDDYQNVWVSHEYGVTRIAPVFPFRSFHHYEGLRGNVLCAKTYDGEVYVGTSLGLFKLVGEDKYDEIVSFADGPQSRDISTPVKEEEVKRKRGLFRFLKRNREKEANTISPPDEKNDLSESNTGAGRVKHTRRIFRSVDFQYQKVAGIEAKVTSIEVVAGKLLVAGLSGIYEVKDGIASAIVEEPVRHLFGDDGYLLVSNSNDELLVLKENSLVWNSTRIPIEDQITDVVSNGKGDVWLYGLSAAYRLELKERPDVSERIPFPDSEFSKTVGVLAGEQLLVANGTGFFHINRLSGAVDRIDSLGVPGMLFSYPDAIWYHDGHAWNSLGADATLHKLPMLSLCNDVRYIASPDEKGNVWIVNGNNELYRFLSDRVPVVADRFPIYLKSVSQGNAFLDLSRIKADQEKGALVFELSHPGYTDGLATEYRYRVAGLDGRWSDWATHHNRISFPYLPHGNYTLSVQSRDIFGNLQQLDGIKFRIDLPYWRTPWFYAMEVTIFVLLIWLSFKLSFRYRFVSRLLSLLTIILLIELIQTIAGYSFSSDSSPVIDFLIQVAVAFVILPVEGFLRNLWFKSTGANSRLYQVISELDRVEKNRK